MKTDRRQFGLLAGAAVFAAASPALAKSKIPADSDPLTRGPRDPIMSYEGRTADMKTADGTLFVRASFPGVVLRINFNGSRLVLKTTASSENVFLDLSVDGASPKVVRLATGAKDLVVFDGADGVHSVTIARRTESWEGQWDIAGATLDKGRFLPPPALPAKKLMFIGDSITCGAGTDVTRDDPRQDMAVNDAQKSFGKVLAATLGTQCHLVSYGGRGVYRDWQGIQAINNAPQFYDRAAPDEPGLIWNPADYVPDAVGICLGTNDFNQGIPDQNDFINTYVEFIDKVRRDAPRARVVVINSPMLTDGDIPKRTVCGAYLDEVVRRASSPLVVRAQIAHYPGRPSNSHPIAEEHVAIAAELEPLFRGALS